MTELCNDCGHPLPDAVGADLYCTVCGKPLIRLLVDAEDVTDEILVLVDECVEAWFSDGPFDEDKFWDKLANNYLRTNGGYDIEQLESPAAERILERVDAGSWLL